MADADRRRPLPTGTVTFLFSDIEGSTRLLGELGPRYEDVLDEHSRILRSAIETNRGTVVNTEGDSFFAAFTSAVDGLRAAAVAQRSLDQHEWPPEGEIRVRMGIHTGEGRLGGDDYVGMDVNRAARIAAAGHGGQVLLTETIHALAQNQLPEGTSLRDLGEHRLKDLPRPERLWQLDVEGLHNEHPPVRSLDARPNNLPQAQTPLIGRDHELETIEQLIDKRRLVTLTGPGGAGKTRLAVAVALRLLPRFGDGAFFVALENARDRATVASEIAAALAVREKPDRDLEQGMKAFLRERELLLVLDNFEQVLGAAPLVSELIAGAVRLQVIATSREALRLSDEQEFSVPPLSLPDPRNLPPLDALSQYESVALFIERARAVRPDFSVTNENAPAVAEICSRLDGLPLAIELAAARVKLFSPQQILDRLERSLTFLTGGARDRSNRQRTLRGAIDWSHELLDEPERRLFARLSVFAGGWMLDAAEEVCNPEDELTIDTLDGLTSLADKSLIHPADPEETEGPRFQMLQVIREFASERLDESPDAEEMRRQHAQHLLGLVERAEPELVRTKLREWQERLRREEENLRAALHWTVQSQKAETGLRLAASLWRYWHYWALVREGRSWLERLLEVPGAADPTVARARALVALAGLAYWQGDAEGASAMYEEALEIFRRNGEEAAVADTLMDTAWAAAARGDGQAAGDRAGQALAQYQRLGNEGGVARVAAWLRTGAYLLDLGGSFEDAVAAGKQDLETARREGRAYDAAEAFGALAIVHRKAGEYARGLEYARQELKELHAQGHIGRHGAFLKLMAAFELSLGRPRRAVRLAAASRRWMTELGGELPEALTHSGNPLEATRQLLGDEEHARGVEEGSRMSLDEAITYALSDEH